MIKKCPKCGSEKMRWNSSKVSLHCKECGYVWKRNRKNLKEYNNLECPECDKQMLRKKVPYEFKGKQFGEYEAYVCEKCNTTYFTEKSFQEIEDKAKELGVWGEGMKIIEEVEEYENPFFGERYFGHEDCYEEFEKFRKRVLEIVRGI